MKYWMRATMALTLAGMPLAASPAQDAPSGTARFKGSCEPNPMLENMMRSRDHAESVTTAKCGLAVVEWGKSVTFFRGNDAVIIFTGHKGDETDITMDQVAVGGKAAAPTTNGRCRFYKDDISHDMLILCFAAYRDGDKPAGAIATFRTTGSAS